MKWLRNLVIGRVIRNCHPYICVREACPMLPNKGVIENSKKKCAKEDEESDLRFRSLSDCLHTPMKWWRQRRWISSKIIRKRSSFHLRIKSLNNYKLKINCTMRIKKMRIWKPKIMKTTQQDFSKGVIPSSQVCAVSRKYTNITSPPNQLSFVHTTAVISHSLSGEFEVLGVSSQHKEHDSEVT